MSEKIYFTAEIYGMCGGVHAALKTLEEQISSSQESVFVFHELVHNRFVTASFRERGVVFAENIEDIPNGATLIIGAHGTAPDVEAALRRKAGRCIDATCPLVKKLHHIAAALDKEDELIIFGKAGHPEVNGVAGHSRAGKLFLISSPDDARALPDMVNPVFISQTTVDHEEVTAALQNLKKRFLRLRESSNICDASRKRQHAVIKLAQKCDAVIVIGSNHSSNAKRLQEIARRNGTQAFLIDNASDLDNSMLNFSKIGITSGASTPQYLFDEVISAIESHGFIPGN